MSEDHAKTIALLDELRKKWTCVDISFTIDPKAQYGPVEIQCYNWDEDGNAIPFVEYTGDSLFDAVLAAARGSWHEKSWRVCSDNAVDATESKGAPDG